MTVKDSKASTFPSSRTPDRQRRWDSNEFHLLVVVLLSLPKDDPQSWLQCQDPTEIALYGNSIRNGRTRSERSGCFIPPTWSIKDDKGRSDYKTLRFSKDNLIDSLNLSIIFINIYFIANIYFNLSHPPQSNQFFPSLHLHKPNGHRVSTTPSSEGKDRGVGNRLTNIDTRRSDTLVDTPKTNNSDSQSRLSIGVSVTW